jgi:hypothetical protein
MDTSLPKIKKEYNASPGVNISKIAGIAISPAKIGINTHTLFIKNHIFIFERHAKNIVKIYIRINVWTCLTNDTPTKDATQRPNLSGADSLCKKPGFLDSSSENMDSLKKERAPHKERSMKFSLGI